MNDDISIPTIPIGILVLLNFFAPFATAVAIDPRWPAKLKKGIAVVVAIVLAIAVVLFSWWMGDPLPDWPALILLAVVISQASYALITKRPADALAGQVGTGSGDGDSRG
jgi:threonine/homoserine efflux transporter RhtA